MKRFVAVLGILSLLTAPLALARESSAVTVTSTGTSATNGTSFATTFAIPDGTSVAGVIQCDAAAYYLAVTSSAGAVTSSTGLKVAADEKWPITISSSHPYIAVISVSGTANCKVSAVY